MPSPKCAGVPVDSLAGGIEVSVKHDAGMGAARKALQRPFASLDRRTAQIFAVEFEQIETAEYRGRAMLLAAHEFENRKSALVATIASPSITHDRAGSWATAKAINGKRLVKSLPLRA